MPNKISPGNNSSSPTWGTYWGQIIFYFFSK
uniref:Uncharacterized protein n=1 Tax=Anguilla anguilla TaxID=7936 RepID=A0A0E9WE53_ANGAN